MREQVPLHTNGWIYHPQDTFTIVFDQDLIVVVSNGQSQSVSVAFPICRVLPYVPQTWVRRDKDSQKVKNEGMKNEKSA